MIHKRLLVVSQLVVALFLSPLFLSGAYGQESDSGQVDDGSSSERKPGITVIVDATGEVQIIDKPGAAPRRANKGDQIPVQGTIVTGAGGQVNLALSNGAFFQILENSSFAISQFEQSPNEFIFSNGAAITQRKAEEFGADEAVVKSLDASEEAWNELPSEPTESSSSFALDYGTMIGKSKKLKPGSEMQITTPIGVAGIRGTIWRLTVQRVGGANSNQFRGNLDVSEGRVDFGTKDGSRSVQVKSGFSMNVQAAALGNGAANFDSIGTMPLSAERAQLLASSVQEVSSVQKVFAAVQGSPDVLISTLQALQGVDVNNPQATADAVLSMLGGDAAQTQQVANIVSAVVITRAEPLAAPRVVSEVVSAILTQSPNLASSVIRGVVATTTMSANNDTATVALSQIVTRDAVASAAISAPAQLGDFTASGVNFATTRGSESVAPAISSAIVGSAITALPAQANLIATAAVNAAASANASPANIQNVVAAVANSAAVNAAYAAISNGGDRQAAEQAAADVGEALRESTANTQFSDLVESATNTSASQQAATQAQSNYDNGETPNTDGGTGTQGGPEASGDTTSKTQVDTPKPVLPNQPPPPTQATPTPTPSPNPSNL